MSDDFIPSMYGGNLYRDKQAAKPEPSAEQKQKMATRVAAGMKAANSHMRTIEVDGELMSIPRAEYVQQLESQLREARNEIRDMKTKQARLIKANNVIMNKLREIERELANKIDAR